MKRLIFFVGVYDTLDLFTYELKREFETLGYDTMLFDVRDMPKGLADLGGFISQPVKAMITFNNLGFNMELTPGKNLWDELGIPCINILMDHPFCYHNSLQAAPRASIVLCTDRNHMRYVQRFYPDIPVTGYLPHAGKEISDVRKPMADRTIDVIYAGNLSKSFAENIMPDFSKYQEFDAREVCREAYEDLIEHPYKTTEEAIEQSLLSKGLTYEEFVLREIISDLHFIDLYAVSYYREKTVRTLVENGVHVTLFGAGWDTCPWITSEYVSYGGKIPAEEVVVKMQDAKVVLSTMTWFKDGTHDRVFNGMLQGAVAVSDTSGYMLEEFCGRDTLYEDGELRVGTEIAQTQQDMLLFELEEIETLPQRVKRVLADNAYAKAIADRGYEKAKRLHTWKMRAKELEEDVLSIL